MRAILVTINPSNDQLVCKNPMLRQLYAGLAFIVCSTIPFFIGNATGFGYSLSHIVLGIVFVLGILLALTFTTGTFVLSKTGVSSYYLRRLLGRKRNVHQFTSSSVTAVSLGKRTRPVLNLMSPFARDHDLTENLLVLQMSDSSSIRIAITNTAPQKTPFDAGAKQIADFLGVPLLIH
jgi:hypothetical protein